MSWKVIGPYFLCVPTIIQEQLVVVCCSNADCVKHGKTTSNKFCGECGSAVTKKEIRTAVPKQRIDAVDIDLQKLGGMTFGDHVKNSIHIYYPYYEDSFDNPMSYVSHGDGKFSCNVTSQQVDQAKQSFVENFQEDYQILKKEYGEENVQVCWGIVGEE